MVQPAPSITNSLSTILSTTDMATHAASQYMCCFERRSNTYIIYWEGKYQFRSVSIDMCLIAMQIAYPNTNFTKGWTATWVI